VARAQRSANRHSAVPTPRPRAPAATMKLAVATCDPGPGRFGPILAVPRTRASSTATTVSPGGASTHKARAWPSGHGRVERERVLRMLRRPARSAKPGASPPGRKLGSTRSRRRMRPRARPCRAAVDGCGRRSPTQPLLSRRSPAPRPPWPSAPSGATPDSRSGGGKRTRAVKSPAAKSIPSGSTPVARQSPSGAPARRVA
jgi:hypothetical protein